MKSFAPEELRYTLRVGFDTWMDKARRRELQDLIKKPGEIFDEIALFTSVEHRPLRLDLIEERARLAEPVMEEFRELGFAVGFNHLATLGHREDDPRTGLSADWERARDLRGNTSEHAFSPLDDRFRNYVRAAYRVLAEARPDFIWIDDDFRLDGVGGLKHTGFCGPMLEALSKRTGEAWTLERVREVVNSESDLAGALALRRAIIARNGQALEGLARLIRSAVDEVDPGIAVGLMTAAKPYSGWKLGDWARALGGAEDPARVKWRPGNGFYRDANPGLLLGKARMVGRMNAAIAPYCSDRQYEHENFQYLPLQKSCRIFVAEIGSALASGCNGVAFNMLPMSGRAPLGEFTPWLAAIESTRSFFARMVSSFCDRAHRGVWQAYTNEEFAAVNLGGDWSRKPSGGDAMVPAGDLQEIGIPPSFSFDHCLVTVLGSAAARTMSDQELEGVLTKGLVIDAETLAVLHERGFGQHAGFSLRSDGSGDPYACSIEVFADDALNGEFADWEHNQQMTFSRTGVTFLQPAEGARALSYGCDLQLRRLGAVSGVYENELGGRVLVLGFYPFRSLLGYAVGSLMKRWVSWLAGDKLPGHVASFHKVALWALSKEGEPSRFLAMNLSLDTAEKVELALADPEARYVLSFPNGVTVEAEASEAPAGLGGRTLSLPPLPPWELVLIEES